MKKNINYILTFLLVLLLSHTTDAARKTTEEYPIEPCHSNYNAEPPFLSTSALPSTTLLVDFSGSMNEHAYQDVEVQWDTGTENATAYTGFNSTKEYYGYFDPYTYYEYTDGIFTNSTGPSTNTWNGNFLNWATMHRIDILKKAMTGGNYNSTEKYYTVSKTDGIESRGKYHIYNAGNEVTDLNGNTHYATPTEYENYIGIEQGSSASNFIVHEMIPYQTSPNTFKIESTFDKTYSLNISSEQELGVLHYIGPSTRLALFTFADNDGHGAKVLHHMTSNASHIIDSINAQEPSSSNSDSPLAEALYTIIGYIQQNTDNEYDNHGPRYNDGDSYTVSKTADPFYFLNATDPDEDGENLSCTQQNIIIISDGISTHDKNLPTKFTDNGYDKAGDNKECNIAPDDEGSCYLDDIAYWAHTEDLRSDISGNNNVNIYTISIFSKNSTLLKNAARYGGFTDFNEDGEADKAEWDADNNNEPDNFFEATSGALLKEGLARSMTGLINRASSGGSASVVSTSRRGEGLLYQAVFWPELIDEKGNGISWAGDVYAYWLDDNGILYADDGTTDDSDKALRSDDSKISIWYDTSNPDHKRSRACLGGDIVDGECIDGQVKELTSVKHVWRASEWLNNLNDNEVSLQREDYLKNEKRRFIKTWVDFDNDGIIDYKEYDDFATNNTLLTNLKFVDNATIEWIRGKDQTGLRSRRIFMGNEADIPVTWRLGDVINSSPTIVAAPSENYHLYWNSTSEGKSYADFLEEYKDRRIMVYFGGNDGMLHAVNGGFYSEKEHKYYNANYGNGTLHTDTDKLPVGAEMWAYVPYNLLPHLKCLTNINYQHKYYVDLKPRVFDARVFPIDENDPVHIGGWGTLLVCGFNFGGDGFQNKYIDLDDDYGKRFFGSSYFIFDVTNPETPPELLGEMTFDGSLPFGFSINAPTLVASKDEDTIYWYLLFGNGPNYIHGATEISPQALIVPLKNFIETPTAFRPTADLGVPSETTMGIIDFGKTIETGNLKACISTGFVSIDYDFDFFVDMLYYGIVTTEGADYTDRDGGLHRLKMDKKIDPKQVMKFLETDQPVTAAPNAAVKDVYGKTGSIWVYSGTGLFWEKSQKIFPGDQWIFGIEEKRKDQSYDFAPRNFDKLFDVTDIEVLPGGDGILQCAGTPCPTEYETVEKLGDYIQSTSNIEGWKRKLAPNERILGQPTLFGGLTNFTTFTPSNDLCTAEGTSTLYALYYRTGTAWKENVFGTATGDTIPFTADLGQGMGITPSLHLGSEAGVRVYVQTSTGSIIEIHQPNLPIPGVKSGAGGWHTLEVD